MALKPMNCPAHIQIFNQGIKSLPRPADPDGRVRLLPPQRAARRAARADARAPDHAGRRAHLLPRGPDRRGGRALSASCSTRSTATSASRTMRSSSRCGPDKRFGTDESWDQAEKELRDAVAAAGRATAEYGWEELPGEGAFYAPKLEFHLTDAIGRTWQVRHAPARLRAARAARRDLCRRGRRASTPGDAPPRDPRLVRALHRHPDRALRRQAAALAGAGAGGGRDDRLGRRRLCARSRGAARRAAGIRAETDLRNEKINYKVREHALAQGPVLLVVGKREAEERHRRAAPARRRRAAGGDRRSTALVERLADRGAAARSVAGTGLARGHSGAKCDLPGAGRLPIARALH